MLKKPEKIDILFERKCYKKMLEWKNKYAPDYALFLKGARRVGKSVLAETLGLNEFKSYIIINFNSVSSNIKNLFVNSLEDLDYFFEQLQYYYKTTLYKGESLIILDEIQLFPEARQALKTLLEDKRYAYIETGSLASVTKQLKNILIPSEEYDLDVYPLDFEEFLLALKEERTINLINDHFISLKPFGISNNEIKKLFRTYMLVGGMPQAVSSYIKNQSFEDCDFAKKRIISLYEKDINNQEETNINYLLDSFKSIPSQLSKHDKRFVFSNIKDGARVREYGPSIKWLKDAFIINIAYSVTDPSIAFNLTTSSDSFKAYMMDTGLLVSLTYNDGTSLDNDLYKSILFDKVHVNEGMIIENIIAQNLKSNNHNLYYFKKTDKVSKKVVCEVNFIVRSKNTITPIEVKSSSNYKTKSLDYFIKTYSKLISTPIVFHNGDIQKENGILYLPYFMVMCLK